MFGIMAKRSHNIVPIMFAAYCLGCPYNALSPSYEKLEVRHMLSITRPSVVFCDVDKYEQMVACLADSGVEAKIITMDGKVDECEQVEDLFVETGSESTFE